MTRTNREMVQIF
ncbi:unnamed protein product [Spirodela intermedia]|uniref:Uncharacterized protein n=2 Tax=Liliopsida TaxID=4447 RepID=A0A7I8JRK7_SPIIN|nr:unnamed protein product [Spirodela intermedia]CAA6672062.1 unnamed protein product [Spirodela intermedia]